MRRTSLRWLCVMFVMAGNAAPAIAAPPEVHDGLAVAVPDDVSLNPAPLAELTQEIVDAQFPDTTSVLVLKDGRLAFERYFGAGGIDVFNDTRSATKTITSMIVGAAIADGALRSIDQPAFALLRDLAPFRNDGALKKRITLADLLTMSSALDCNDFDDRNVGNEENMYPLRQWSRWVVDLPVKQDYLRGPNGRGPFSYCTGGAFLLGQIVERATHKALDEYVDLRLLHPLGIRKRQWVRSPSGEFQGGGGLRLRSRDLVKLSLLLTSGGQWHGQSILPASWVQRMQTVSNPVNEQQSYGMLYWQRSYASPCGPIDAWYMSGNGGNAVVSVPSRSMVALVTRAHYNQRGMHDETVRLLEQHVFAALRCAPTRN